MPMTQREPGTRHLSLVVAENARRERFLMLEGACRHDGEILVSRTVRDLSDIETTYGQCAHCKNWVTRTTWFGRRGDECYDTTLMSPREIDALVTPYLARLGR